MLRSDLCGYRNTYIDVKGVLLLQKLKIEILLM